MSKPRGQKAPRRFLVVAVLNSRPPAVDIDWSGGYWLQRGTMRTGLSATACAMLIGLCVASSPPEAAAASASSLCAKDTRTAIATARSALEKVDVANDRDALVCLVDAVAALDERIEGLSNGSVPFDGPVYAPKGVTITKPSVQEAR